MHECHFVMEYMTAGNLFDYIYYEGALKLTEAKICCAEMVLALQYLHEHEVVYRDLKLENILIHADGHIMLTDFGLARKIKRNQKLTDRSGTHTYFAPGEDYRNSQQLHIPWNRFETLISFKLKKLFLEIVSSNKGHSYEVDWWSLGIIIFELLIGHSPFMTEPQEDVSAKTLSSRIVNQDPCLQKLLHVTPDVRLREFIEALLIKDPAHRLGELKL